MIVALLFVVFHDFAINSAESTQHSTQMMTQETLHQESCSVSIEHQSFHQPFLITSDAASSGSPKRETTLYDDKNDYSHFRSIDIFSPPKA